MIFYISNRESLYPDIKLTNLEQRIINTKTFQQLKRLSETGATAMITSLKHSRFQSAMGLLKLTARFYESDQLIRLAGLLYHTLKKPVSSLGEAFEHDHDLEPPFKAADIQTILKDSAYHADDITNIIHTSPVFTSFDNQMTLADIDQCLRESERIKNPSIEDVFNGLSCDSEKGCVFDENAAKAISQRMKAALAYRFSFKARLAESCMSRAIRLYQSANQKTCFEAIKLSDDKSIVAALSNSSLKDIHRLINMVYDSTMKIKAMSHKYFKHQTTLFDPRQINIKYPKPYKEEIENIESLLSLLHHDSLVYLP